MYFIVAYSVMIGVEFLYIILSNTTTALLAKTGLIPVSEFMAIVAYKISELYCVYSIKADDCKIKKKNDE